MAWHGGPFSKTDDNADEDVDELRGQEGVGDRDHTVL